jgi:hypothetical protein
VKLVELVRASTRRCARAVLDELRGELKVAITGIAIRACPPLPPTVAERLTDYRAQNVADSVMYREALADAATARRWSVVWYEAKHVFDQAARALGTASVDRLLSDTGKSLGRPWQKDHRIAMAAAIAAHDAI